MPRDAHELANGAGEDPAVASETGVVTHSALRVSYITPYMSLEVILHQSQKLSLCVGI